MMYHIRGHRWQKELDGVYKSAVHLILSVSDRTLIFIAEIFVSRTERTFLSNTASVHYTSKDILLSHLPGIHSLIIP